MQFGATRMALKVKEYMVLATLEETLTEVTAPLGMAPMAMVAVAAPDVKILVEALVAVMHQTELTELTRVVILVALEAFR